MTAQTHRPRIGVEKLEVRRNPHHSGPSREFWAVTVGGSPVGPALVDEGSAGFAAEWLRMAFDGIRQVLARQGVDLTLEQAMGLGPPPGPASIEADSAPQLPPPEHVESGPPPLSITAGGGPFDLDRAFEVYTWI